ncbi:hypothetical protein AGMMS50276_17210 [Synergistales bacterium]|nr:hypothetical protein AGMMS50276_17210 [Synergistales bacterium]
MSIVKLSDNQKLFKEGIIVFPEAGEPYIAGSRCRKCGKLHYPARPLCTECYSEDLEPAALSREGTIYSMTYVNLGVNGFKTPYILAWVDLDESRLAAQIDWDPERIGELKHGQKVRVVADVLRVDANGTEIVGYKFQPVFAEVK